jgi:predicted helicase
VVDLKGNIRKDSMRDGIPLGEQHTVFGLSAMVGVSVVFLVRAKHLTDHKIFYSTVDFRAKRAEKFALLEQAQMASRLKWQEITPDKRHTWLTAGLQDEFETFLPLGTQEAKSGLEESVLFTLYSNGLKTNRDTWVYNFHSEKLAQNIQRLLAVYNEHVRNWATMTSLPPIDDFVSNDSKLISWSDGLKQNLERKVFIKYDNGSLRVSLYRPFTPMYTYFNKHLNERRYQLPLIFPTIESEQENRIICVPGVNNRKAFGAFLTNQVIALDLAFEKAQCFPFYTYDEDGANRRENITDWALATFRHQYAAQSPDHPITKWDIFHYVYALLHHPDYRTQYAANLRRELPRIPFVEDFWGFAQAGARLAALHVEYEQQPEYPLDFVENPDLPLDWRVERMKLSKDKSSLVYNDFLTLAGIPPQVYDYKLGNRSALDWVIDQYQVSTDKRSGIVNDPNQPADPQAIVRLIGQVITVSLETVQSVNNLPPLTILAPK